MPQRFAFANASPAIWLPSSMPSLEPWFGIITSIAKPLGCHFKASWRYPPIVVISGNITLIALAANNSASAGMATFGAAVGAASEVVGATAAVCRQHGVSGLWAYSMPAETASEAATANQRPRPLANRFLLTDGTLLSYIGVRHGV